MRGDEVGLLDHDVQAISGGLHKMDEVTWQL